MEMQRVLHLESLTTPPARWDAPDAPDAPDIPDASDLPEDSHVPHVAAMFGLGPDDAPRTLIPPADLRLGPGRVVFITGPSGGGKSTLLRLIDAALGCGSEPVRVVRFDRLPPLPDRPVVDCFGVPLARVLAALSRAGLGDAFVMLRRPRELSDGQRYRLRLAQTMLLIESMAASGGRAGSGLAVVLADEFGATLDRVTAAVIAHQVRQWVTASGVCLIAATTHDDLLEPLGPDVLVYKPLGGAMRVMQREAPSSEALSTETRRREGDEGREQEQGGDGPHATRSEVRRARE